MTEFSEGQLIALRRDRLGWTQPELARAMGVSTSTLLRVEKGTNRQRPNYAAAIAALEKEEARRGLTSPDQPVREDGPSQEGVDAAAQLHAAKADLVRLNATLLEAAKDIRRAMDTLDALADTQTKRKRA